MTADRWQEINRLYYAALEVEEKERPQFLEHACGTDAELRSEVESLLNMQADVNGILDRPAAEEMIRVLKEELPSLLGKKMGPYKILSLLGAGGMGEVYLAQDSRLDRTVAVKVLPSEVASDPERLWRFVREAKAASALNHPNIAHIYEISVAESVHFIAMEYVQGQTLAAKISGRPLPAVEIVEIGIQAADALDEAHTKGIIHRDIKPANLMLTLRSQLKVLDFGLAKVSRPEGREVGDTITVHTAPGMVMGTVEYMSPEQVLGREVDHRGDLFSLGVVLYEMATGRRPFSGATTTETMDRILHGQPEALVRFNPDVPAELERIVRKCLEKDLEQRYRSARELWTDLGQLKRHIDSGPVTAAVESRKKWPRLPSARSLLLIASLATLATAVLVYLLVLRDTPTPVSPDIKSLAVLPLENLSGDPGQEYFVDGMTEALITDLAKIGALRVISRTSVMRYKATQKPLPEIARELNVDAVVEGSVLRSGERVRITAQLIHAQTDRHLWAENYERDLREVLALQREVARAIADEVRARLTAQEQMLLAKVRPVNPEAYDFFLRARFLYFRGNDPDNQAAIEMLERSVALAPAFAAGYAALARSYVERLFFLKPEQRHVWEEKAYVAVQKALSLDPNLMEAYIARGRLLWTPSNHFPHERAFQEFRRALALNPNSDEAHSQIALILTHVGLLDEALQEVDRAAAINPSAVEPLISKGSVLLWQGKYELAVQVWLSIPRKSFPSVVGSHAAWGLFQLGKKDQALDLVQQFLRDYPEDSGGLLVGMQALLLAAEGEERKSEAKIKSAVKNRGFGQFHHTAHYIASAYARMNKPEPAVFWLQEAAETGFPCYPLFERDPNLDPVRSDPRFVAFMGQLKKRWEHYKATLSLNADGAATGRQ